MISLERYLSVHQLSDGIIDRIVSAETSYLANRCLFGYMTFVIIPDHEDSLFTFCNYLETVIGNREMQGVIEQLRNGMYVLYTCLCLYITYHIPVIYILV